MDRLITALLELRQQTVAPNNNSVSQMAPLSNAELKLLLQIMFPGDLALNAGASNHVAAALSTSSPSQNHRSGMFDSATLLTTAAPGGSTKAAATSVSGPSQSSGPQDDGGLFPKQTNEERWAMRFEELKRFKQVRKYTSFQRCLG